MIIYESDNLPPKSNTKLFVVIALVVGLLLGASILWWQKPWQKDRSAMFNTQPSTSQTTNTTTTKTPSQTQTKETPAAFDSTKLKSTVSNFVKTHGGTYGITLMDTDGKTLAEANGHKQFFTASIYKLYTAYIGYQKVDDGSIKLSEPYLNGWTRKKCMFEMIHSSNSPCAEKLWNELGKSSQTTKLKTYGLTDTDMTGLVTSSHDAAIILQRLWAGKELSSSSRGLMLDSMEAQIYRAGLPTGFKGLTMYDKVGFNNNIEYHDTAIVRFNGGRTMIVSVLTSNAGTTNIVKLAQAITAATE